MRILMLPGYRYPASLDEPLTCGDLRYSFTLSRALVRAGASVTVLSRGTRREPESTTFDGVKIQRYRPEFGRVFATSFDISLRRAAAFRALVRQSDAVIANSPLSLELLGSTRVPMVYVCSGLEDVRNYGWSLGELAQWVGIQGLRDPCKRATWRRSVVVNTTAEREAPTLARLGVPAAKIRTIGPGVERGRYVPLPTAAVAAHRAALGIGAETRVILSVSRITPAKGLLETVEAFAALRAATRLPVLLLLVGVRHSHRGDYFGRVLRRIEALGLTAQVRWAMDVPERELPLYYSLADLTSVFSVGYDPLPTVLIESQACGTPVISTRMETRRQLIDHGTNGLEVAEADVRGWTAAAQHLLENAGLAASLREHGLRFVAAHADADVVAARYLELLASQ